MSDTDEGGFVSKFISTVIGDKRRWRQYKARVRQLPPNYRTAVDAIERYLMHFGAVDADSAASLFEDVADLFDPAAADGTPIREIVGEDPVEFVDALIRNYEKSGYVDRERQRLINAIAQAAGEKPGKKPGPSDDDTGRPSDPCSVWHSRPLQRCPARCELSLSTSR